MNDNNLDNIFRQLGPHLREYLIEHGVIINESNFFSCIALDHDDAHPSMSIGGKEPFKDTVAHCFSCQKSYNIIHAANIFEKLPIAGPGFFETTLKKLCEKYKIEYEPLNISEDIKRKYQRYNAYKDAVDVLHSKTFIKGVLKSEHPAIKHLLNRGISEESIRKFQIGAIDSTEEYLETLAITGWEDKDWLAAADLTNKKLFSPTGIIIPIFDDKNRPVGFVTRRTDMAENEHGQEKYVNSSNSDIYCKGEILFNLNNCNPDKGALLIVEGYLDAVYLSQCGIQNVAAIGATVLTEAHVNLLLSKGYSKLYVCLDGDDAGIKGTKLAIERIEPYQFFKLYIVDLPEGLDPDSYVRTNGIEAYKQLIHPDHCLTSFIWTLKHHTFEEDPHALAERAIPIIANEEKAITRLRYIKELAQITGITENDIKKDVDILVNQGSNIFLEEVKKINTFVQKQLQVKKIHDTKIVLSDAISRITTLEQLHTKKIDEQTDYIEQLDEIEEKLINGKYKYGLITPNFKQLENLLDGLPFNANLTLMGGRASSAKTTTLTNLALDALKYNEDLVVSYMSIDDTRELMVHKILAMETGMSTSEIKRIIDRSDKDKQLLRNKAKWLRDLSDRFIIVDSKNGTTIEAFEAHVNYLMSDKFKDYKKLMLLDNFHKISIGGTSKQKSESIDNLSQRIKNITQVNNLHTIMTVELRKMGLNDRPSLLDFKDSVQLEYDADIAILFHNDLQVDENSRMIHMGQTYEGDTKVMPIIEMTLAKNKVTGKIGRMGYQLNSHNLRMTEMKYSAFKEKFDNNSKAQKESTFSYSDKKNKQVY